MKYVLLVSSLYKLRVCQPCKYCCRKS